MRARAKRELIDRLKEKKYTDGIIDSAVRDLSSVGLIDDTAFARQWITRQMENNCGKIRVVFELREKGIDEKIINTEINAAFKNFDETKAASAQARKFANIHKGLKPESLTRRLYAHLARKGFSENITNDVVRNIVNQYDHQRT